MKVVNTPKSKAGMCCGCGRIAPTKHKLCSFCLKSQRVTVKGFAMTKLDVELQRDAVLIHMGVLDRNHEQPTTITIRWPTDDSFYEQSPEALAKQVRNLCIDALTHELDECLRLDGKRVFDPHKRPREGFPLYDMNGDRLPEENR
jgi:hypothetical protein